MNTKLLLIPLIVAGFAGCSTAYKTAQTPDDVYFSPVPPHDDYVRSDNDENRNVYNGESSDDRAIRRTIHNRRWRRYHDYDYGYGYPYGYYPYGYYPYGYPTTGKPPVNNSQARKYNLGTYTNPVNTTPSSVIGTKTGNQPTSAPVRTFPAQPKGTAVGNMIRGLFSGSRSNSDGYDGGSQTRTFDSKNSNSSNNNSSGSNKSSSNSSSAPVRTFPKK